uniref:Uncharacterized protein n=1 Tax=Arundo donax TaxID=35708 RepID=A0A0A9HZ01_ARUDO
MPPSPPTRPPRFPSSSTNLLIFSPSPSASELTR